MPDSFPHTACRVCQTPLPSPFLDLGSQPLANNLLGSSGQHPDLYPLALACCLSCSLIQLTHTVDPHLLFDSYLYLSGISKQFKRHLESLADTCAKELHLPPDAAVLDIGGNDGTLLHAFQQHGCRVLNVEPAKEPANLAAGHGVPTINRYFDDETAMMVKSVFGPLDLVTATNVFAHVDDVRGLVERIKSLLSPQGTFVIEAVDGDVLMNSGDFSSVYHEHLSTWTAESLASMGHRLGLSLKWMQQVDSHGGSLRVAFSPEPSEGTPHFSTANGEVFFPPMTESRLTAFAELALERRQQLRDLLSQTGDGTLAAYTAPAKATAIANYCGLWDFPVQYVVDDAPTKQGKFLPLAQGQPIPIKPFSHLKAHPVDTLILFAWNLPDLAEIIAPFCHQILIPMPIPRLASSSSFLPR